MLVVMRDHSGLYTLSLPAKSRRH